MVGGASSAACGSGPSTSASVMPLGPTQQGGSLITRFQGKKPVLGEDMSVPLPVQLSFL